MSKRDYIGDIAEIRSMMERSSKFMTLTGWAGILPGIYALAGAFIAYRFFQFNPDEIQYDLPSENLSSVVMLAVVVLVLALCTAIFFCYKQAGRKGERLWNPTAKRLLINLMVPLMAGGLLLFVLMSNGFIGYLAPFSLIFYGVALFNAGKFTYSEIKSLGLLEIGLGLLGSVFVEYGLLLWAIGFGVLHILYGFYMRNKYEQ